MKYIIDLPATHAVIKHAMFVLIYDLNIIVAKFVTFPLLSTAQIPTKTAKVPKLEKPHMAHVVSSTAVSYKNTVKQL